MDFLKNRNRLTDIKNKLMVTKGEREWGGINSLGLADTKDRKSTRLNSSHT